MNLKRIGVRDVIFVVMVLVMIWAAVQSQRTSAELTHQAKARQESLRCLSTWAEKFATALDARTNASTATQQGAHDQAIDDVQLAVLAAIKSGKDPAHDANLAAKLDAFKDAKAALDDARAKNKLTTAKNPYPDPPSHCME